MTSTLFLLCEKVKGLLTDSQAGKGLPLLWLVDPEVLSVKEGGTRMTK